MPLDQKEACHEKACDFLSDPPLRADPGRLAVGSARAADNVAMDICTSCTNAAQFEDYAMGHIPSGAYFWTSAGERMQVGFFIFNPDPSLAAIIAAHGPCLATVDGGLCTWHLMWDDLTGTTTEEQSTFSELAPSMTIDIPSSVASTFTGTSQEAAVSAWLETNLAKAGPPFNFVIVTIFPDGSDAEYQVTATAPLTFSLVSGSGHAGNGEPLDDSGEPVAATGVDVLTPPVGFNVKQQIQGTMAQEQAADAFDMGTSPGLGSAGVSGGTGLLSSVNGPLGALGTSQSGEGKNPGKYSTPPPSSSWSYAADLSYWDVLICTASGGKEKVCSPPTTPPKGT